jgi:hypothetical protein
MKRSLFGLAALALAAAACGQPPVPSRSPAPATTVPSDSAPPSASTSPRPVATTRLELATEFQEHCGSIGGCAAYVAVIPNGETDSDEFALASSGSVGERRPEFIGPGSYTVRFRLAGVSDDREVGAPPDEWTIATCEEDIDVFDQEAVNIAVTFERDSCETSATYTITIID